MEAAGLLSGGAPVIKRFQVNATISNGTRGVPVTIMGTTNAGVVLSATNTGADLVGLATDNATYTTTQGSGADSAERLVSVIVNPDLILKARLNNGQTEGTALALATVTTANSAGTTITASATDPSSPDMAGGMVWGYSGANAGQARHIVSTGTTNAFTLTVPFDYTIAVGDTFLYAPVSPCGTLLLYLTAAFYEIDAAAAVGSGGNWACLDMELNDLSGDGRLKSYAHILGRDHILNPLS